MKKTLLAGIFMFSMFVTSTSHAQTNCHPAIKNNEKNYLIGYGSLMQTKSRQRSNPNAEYVYPIELKGFERIWGYHGGHYKTTFLTLIKNEKSSLNAVYYPVNYKEIQVTDQREKGYCRINIAKENISSLGLDKLPSGTYWVYAQKGDLVQKANKQYPLVQSYVDIFIDGCMEIANRYQLKKFVNQCITKTSGWPESGKNLWINDRLYPRRPFNVPNGFRIDALLTKYFDDYYNHTIE